MVRSFKNWISAMSNGKKARAGLGALVLAVAGLLLKGALQGLGYFAVVSGTGGPDQTHEHESAPFTQPVQPTDGEPKTISNGSISIHGDVSEGVTIQQAIDLGVGAKELKQENEKIREREAFREQFRKNLEDVARRAKVATFVRSAQRMELPVETPASRRVFLVSDDDEKWNWCDSALKEQVSDLTVQAVQHHEMMTSELADDLAYCSAAVCFLQGDWEESLELLNRMSVAQSFHVLLLRLRVLHAIGESRKPEYETLLAELINDHPDHSLVSYLEAVRCLEQRQLDNAQEGFSRSRFGHLDPEDGITVSTLHHSGLFLEALSRFGATLASQTESLSALDLAIRDVRARQRDSVRLRPVWLQWEIWMEDIRQTVSDQPCEIESIKRCREAVALLSAADRSFLNDNLADLLIGSMTESKLRPDQITPEKIAAYRSEIRDGGYSAELRERLSLVLETLESTRLVHSVSVSSDAERVGHLRTLTSNEAMIEEHSQRIAQGYPSEISSTCLMEQGARWLCIFKITKDEAYMRKCVDSMRTGLSLAGDSPGDSPLLLEARNVVRELDTWHPAATKVSSN